MLLLSGLLFILATKTVSSIWCYRCVSTQPGCGLFDFDIRIYWSHYCNDPNDKCVKLIQQKGASVIVTRDCLSNLEGHRRDIPADHYEGCRPAAEDPLLGHYSNNSIPEIDIKRNYYDSTLYCFCDFDERCNNASTSDLNFMLFLSSLITWVISKRM
ncbi:UNVERIFIED_CONTAM: hypothetical protein RMT77_000819 [Armadillidium vulgare]|nr:hypothetical protein Avbf_01577 [Armadillidium vulgare]